MKDAITHKRKVIDPETGEVHTINMHQFAVSPKYNFQTQYNAATRERYYEVNNDPSETIPDQTMSVKEILTRYASGLPIDGQKVPIYENDEDPLHGVNWNTLDLSEKADFIQALKSDIEETRKNWDEQEKRRKQKQAKEAIDKRVKKELEKRSRTKDKNLIQDAEIIQDNPEP